MKKKQRRLVGKLMYSKGLKRSVLRGVLLVMVLVGAVSQTGCKSYTEILEEKILQALEEKYDESFVVDSIGGNWAGGFPNSSTVQALCYPEADSSLRFVVEIQKETYEVYDRYLNKLVGRNEEPYIQKLAFEVWENSTVIVSNDTVMTYPKEADRTMRNSEFLKLYPQTTQMVYVFIKGEEEVDAEVEIEKLTSLTNKLTQEGYRSSYISIRYIEPQTYEQIPQIRKEEYAVNGYVDEIGKVYCMMGAIIEKDGTINLNKEQYIENLSEYGKWEE